MLTNKTKILSATVAIFVLSFIGVSSTNSGVELVATLIGTDTQTIKCLAQLPESKQAGEYTFTKQRIDTDSTNDFILTATSEDQCGSAGCTHELCLIKNNAAEIVAFGYAAEDIIIKDVASNGMYGIQLQGRSTTNLQWDGTRYIIVE